MSDTKPTGGPAFPAPDLGERDFGDRGAYTGLSLRDYFAAKAMQAMLGKDTHADTSPHFGAVHGSRANNYAAAAYVFADAMLRARDE